MRHTILLTDSSSSLTSTGYSSSKIKYWKFLVRWKLCVVQLVSFPHVSTSLNRIRAKWSNYLGKHSNTKEPFGSGTLRNTVESNLNKTKSNTIIFWTEPKLSEWKEFQVVSTKLLELRQKGAPISVSAAVSYTHLTLPTTSRV